MRWSQVARSLLAIAGSLAVLGPHPAFGQSPAGPQGDDLTALSLEELMNLKVSTVSRKPEPWWEAPAGNDFVTGDDIRRAQVDNLPDALRLATGVHVGQPSARSWAVSIRGMNVLAANKISVVLDGRSLFTPFFSGVQWDAQDTLLEDVDRIEVVRGPIGALWGAFAVNGFIQVLTKPAWDTQGWLLSAGVGTEDPALLSVRYGGKLGEDTFFRAYGKYVQTDWTYRPFGGHALGATDAVQGGFRMDVRRAGTTTLTLQGDYYTNEDLLLDIVPTPISGGNVLGRWRRTFSSGSELQVEAYFDHTYRLIPQNFEESRDTGSVALKYRSTRGRHDLVVGGDALVSADRIGNMGFALLLPAERTVHTLGAYAQDSFRIHPQVALVAGVKAEGGSFSGVEAQPTVRVAWTPQPRTTAWAAASRAVRTPVRIDEDLVIRFSDITLFEASDDFRTETARAYELGLRHRPTSSLSLAASAFVYRYHDLRSTEPLGSAPIPGTFKNSLDAKSHGAELMVLFQPVPRVLVKGSYRWLDLRFSKDPGSQDTTEGSAEGNDPKHVAVVGAHFTLPGDFELDGFFRLASRLPNPELDGYRTVDARVGWRPSARWEVSLSGRNLLDRQYAEFVTTNSLNEEVHRQVTLKVTCRF
jgi:iron complex outermembrane receptor protein